MSQKNAYPVKMSEEDRQALASIVPSHKSNRAVMERIAELQIARFGLTDTVEEYIEKTVARTEQKSG